MVDGNEWVWLMVMVGCLSWWCSDVGHGSVWVSIMVVQRVSIIVVQWVPLLVVLWVSFHGGAWGFVGGNGWMSIVVLFGYRFW